MNDKSFTQEQIDLARIAKALSHPVRLHILSLLEAQVCCYSGDMAVMLPIARSTLSQHLNELKKAGLIQGSIAQDTKPDFVGLAGSFENIMSLLE